MRFSRHASHGSPGRVWNTQVISLPGPYSLRMVRRVFRAPGIFLGISRLPPLLGGIQAGVPVDVQVQVAVGVLRRDVLGRNEVAA